MRVSAHTIELNQFLEDFTKTSGMLIEKGNEIWYFRYLLLMAKRLQSLDLEIKKKNVALTYDEVV